ncbi:MAG: hypothetical protein HKP27_07590 [Myxococcales bacterium]|nr:hypothetical protein [Myxococcales bacterium]
MHIRQIALVAAELEPAVAALTETLGIEVGFRDPDVSEFGLANAVMPVGDTFLEVVSPERPGTTAGRYLERRGGDGGYMVILQTDDLETDRARVEALGVRLVWQAKHRDIASFHMHPGDTGGAITSLDQPVPPESWRWGGPAWQEHRRTDRVLRIVAAELQSPSPERLAKRWGELLDLPVTVGPAGHAIALSPGELRFVLATDGRGEGLAGIDLEAADADAVLASARTRGLPVSDRQLDVAGVRIRLRN